MPKEILYSAETLRGATATAVVEHVAVGWTKDATVQLGVQAGAKVSMSIDGDPDHTSLWMDLDRDGCNRLIRSLRKARDAAYGADA